MLTIQYEKSFKKDYKLAVRRGYNIELMTEIIGMLARREAPPDRCRDHALTGVYKGCRECHITPDWLLIYRIREEALVLLLTRTGTHSDLF